MDPFFPVPELVSALSIGAATLAAFALGLVAYGFIIDRVVFEAGGRLRTDRFGSLDILFAALLTALFGYSVVLAIVSPAAASEQTVPSANQMMLGVVATTVVFMILVGGILGGLTVRDIRWREVIGLNGLGPVAVLFHAAILFALALPLVTGGTILSRLLLLASGSADDSPQEIVRFLGASHSHAARLVVAGSAVFFAPVFEELVFRGYLYGVVRRYAGVAVGIVLNAALFAAIHTNLPSFGGLFVLAVCLTLAYEWTGSIFVSMTMHSLFNLVSVLSLFQGGASGHLVFHVR